MTSMLRQNIVTRDSLFCDRPLAEWLRLPQPLGPGSSFTDVDELVREGRVTAACEALHDIGAGKLGDAVRHRIEAFHLIRELNCACASELTKNVLGVVLEVYVEVSGRPGIDILAAYADRSLYYLNHAGSAAIGEASDTSLRLPTQKLLSAAENALPHIGPWQGARPPLPPAGIVRLNILTPIGLCFGEGTFSTLSNDPLGGPLFAAATQLVQIFTAKALAENRAKRTGSDLAARHPAQH